MNISHMSVSRKTLWDECKKKYYYKYHLKLDTDEEEPFHFTYGKIIHKIAEVYIENRGDKELQEVVKLVTEGKIPIEEKNEVFAPKIPYEYKFRMPGHLQSLNKITKEIGYDGHLEWDFKYDLDPPNNKFVIGFIDRLIIKNNKAFILDYKTTKRGKFRKNKNTVKTDLQLMTYARIVQKEFNIPAENIHTALFYLEGGNLISTKFSEKSLEEAESILLNCYNEINDYDEKNAWGNVGYHCRFCEYSKICPFYQNKK